MAICEATLDSHCCWVGGQVCIYFDHTGLNDGRDGACSLRSKLGSWDLVHKDPRYLVNVKANVPSFATSDRNCGDYPYVKCGSCGVTA